MAGYSKTSLKQKLGIKDNIPLLIINEPDNYLELVGEIDNQVEHKISGRFSFIHYFSTSQKELQKDFLELKSSLNFDGSLWISWPKKSSKIKTDLTENYVRELGLENGLVDVKICAVDENYFGLKFVYRLKDRHN